MVALIINDYECGEIYNVIMFHNPRARSRAIEVINEVRYDRLPGEWSTDDFWDALAESGIEYKMLDDVEEYSI